MLKNSEVNQKTQSVFYTESLAWDVPPNSLVWIDALMWLRKFLIAFAIDTAIDVTKYINKFQNSFWKKVESKFCV